MVCRPSAPVRMSRRRSRRSSCPAPSYSIASRASGWARSNRATTRPSTTSSYRGYGRGQAGVDEEKAHPGLHRRLRPGVGPARRGPDECGTSGSWEAGSHVRQCLRGKPPTRARASMATTASVRCSRRAMSHTLRSGVVTRQPSTSVISSGSRRAKSLRSSTSRQLGVVPPRPAALTLRAGFRAQPRSRIPLAGAPGLRGGCGGWNSGLRVGAGRARRRGCRRPSGTTRRGRGRCCACDRAAPSRSRRRAPTRR